jgi:hypothetical protein
MIKTRDGEHIVGLERIEEQPTPEVYVDGSVDDAVNGESDIDGDDDVEANDAE